MKVLTGQVGINIFSLAFGIYFAHVLELKEMAILAIFFLIGGVFPVICSLGMNDTLIKRIPALIEEGKRNEADEIFLSSLCVQLVVILCVTSLSLLFYREISELFYKSVLPFSTMLIIILYAISQSIVLLMNSMIRAVQSFGQMSIVKIVEQISARILAVIFFFIWHVNGLLLGMLMGTAISSFIYVYYLRKHFDKQRPTVKKARELVQYSFPYYGAAWLRFSVMHADRYFVSIFFHPEQLAIYHIASKITSYVITAMDAIANPIASKLSQLNVYGRERTGSIYNKVFRYYSLLYIPLIGMMIAFARPIIELYGGVKYSDGALVLMILASGLLLAPFSSLIETYVFILGKPVEIFKIRFFSGIFSLLGAYGLMKMLGVYGLALSKVFIWGIYIVVGMLLLRKHIHVSVDKVSFFKVIAISVFIIAVGVFVQNFLYSYWVSAVCFLISILILILFYVTALKREHAFLKEMIPERFRGMAFFNKQ